MFIVIAFIFLGIGLGYTVRTRLAALAGAKAVGIFHGFATDFSVPFLVTMWCMLGA